MGGARYFIIFIDEFSRKMWFYVLKSKGECFERFKEFKTLVDTQSKHNIKAFWSGNGGKFVYEAFNHFLKIHGALDH